MKDKIYEAIKLQSGKITFKHLSKKFDIGTDELRENLQQLKLEGKVLQIENKYMLFPNDLKIGKVVSSISGRKYLLYENKKISINNEYIDNLILHDTVAFKLNQNNEAIIISIIERTLGKMVCEVIGTNSKMKVVPFHSGIKFLLPDEVMDTLFDGDIILVETTPNEVNDYSNVKFIKKIGRRDDPLMDDVSIALNYGFDNDYTEEYMSEVKNLPTFVSEEEIKNRYDFRKQKSFTIDGMYTKDMDDGVYAEYLDNNIIRAYVHIADVSHYIHPDSLIFKRACEKTTSLYLNNSVFHMLHYIISNGICSLNPDEDRLTKTVIMDIDDDGNIINSNIVKSVIHSKKKMVYDDVDMVLTSNIVPLGYENFIKELGVLYDAAGRLEKRYLNNGKIIFANNELKKKYNNDGTIADICEANDSVARKIIEYLMISANETVATWHYNMDIPTVYRIHEKPNVQSINNVITELNRSGFHINRIRDVDDPKVIQKILDKTHNFEEFPIISQMLVMSMQKARYSIDNLGHYALGSSAYLHFTSPIRRLPDLLVHMMTDLILVDYEKLTPEYLSTMESLLIQLSERASRMERQADMAEADAERRLIIKKLEKHIGEEFEAVICEIDKKIRIKIDGIDTYVDPKTLSSNFVFDGKRKLFYDKDTNEYLKIGTRIIIRLANVNVINNTFNAIILSTVNCNVKRKILAK